MSEDDAAKRQPDAEDAAPSSAPLTWLSKFDRGFTLVKSLSVVTVLSSLLLGSFQYLNSYQEKVSAQAKDDMDLEHLPARHLLIDEVVRFAF